MKTILLQNPISFKDLKVKYGIEKYVFVNGCIGYNDEVYFLFSEHVPERIKGMFVNTQANTRYMAVHGIVDWINEELVYEENARVVNRQGEILQASCLGDGIQDCIVTRNGNLHRNYTDWEEL